MRDWLVLLIVVACYACNRAPEQTDSTGSALGVTELRYLGSQRNVSYAELGEDLGYLAPLKLKWAGNVLSEQRANELYTNNFSPYRPGQTPPTEP